MEQLVSPEIFIQIHIMQKTTFPIIAHESSQPAEAAKYAQDTAGCMGGETKWDPPLADDVVDLESL